MKLPYLKRFSTFFLISCVYFLSYSQVPGPEILRANRLELEKSREQNFGELQDIISGREHRAVYHFTNGHPFWKQKSWVLGSVQTKIHYYPSLTVRYDVYKDVLLFLPDSLSIDFLAINQDQVLSFTLEGVPFINLGIGKDLAMMEAINMKPGYYEWVYNGKVNLFAKDWKELKSKTGDSNAHSEFYDRRTMYVWVDDAFYLIKRKKHLLVALAQHKNEMKAYIRKNHLNIRKISDFQFVNLLKHYDSL